MAGAGLNKVMLIGNLGKDPEVRYTQNSQPVASFTLATSESWTDKSGQKQDRTEWHKIVVWGKQAELCGQYLTKGRQVFVEGKLQTREWTNKEGAKQYTTEVVALQVTFLQGGERKGTGARTEPDDFGPPPPGLDEGSAGSPAGGGASYGGRGGGGEPPQGSPSQGRSGGAGGAGGEDLPF
jgi:single-strand DNA-binding protein